MNRISKIALCAGLLITGFFIWIIELAGSHGHIQFRYWMLEDWVFTSLYILTFGGAAYIVISSTYRWFKKKNNS